MTMSLHTLDWMNALLQHGLAVVAAKKAGATSADLNAAAVQEATAALLTHLDTHPEVQAAAVVLAAAAQAKG
jgi:hypothetical protein